MRVIMKNAIKYFYNLEPINIRQNSEEYFFELQNNNYVLQQCNRSIEEIYELYNLSYYLYQNGIYLHQIMLNNNNEFITNINNKNYILLKIINNNDKKISIEDIKKISNIRIFYDYKYIKRNDWYSLWSTKIDYFEYQVQENKIKNSDYVFNIDYFIGLVENALQLLRDIRNSNLYISHQRIKTNMKVRDLYNPLYIILDAKTRDSAEFYKDKLLKDNTVEKNIFEYLNYEKLSIEDLQMFFIRFLYNTKYFDLLDDVILNKNEDKINRKTEIIVNESVSYENILKKIYIYLYSKNIIPEIEWLKKTSY